MLQKNTDIEDIATSSNPRKSAALPEKNESGRVVDFQLVDDAMDEDDAPDNEDIGENDGDDGGVLPNPGGDGEGDDPEDDPDDDDGSEDAAGYDDYYTKPEVHFLLQQQDRRWTAQLNAQLSSPKVTIINEILIVCWK